jgi:hypothetical protein
MSGDQFTLDPAAKEELVNLLKALAACLSGTPGDYNNSTDVTLQGHVNASGNSLQQQVQDTWKQLDQISWFSSLGETGMRAEFETIFNKILPQWCADGASAIFQVINTIEGQSQQATAADTAQQWGHFHPS